MSKGSAIVTYLTATGLAFALATSVAHAQGGTAAPLPPAPSPPPPPPSADPSPPPPDPMGPPVVGDPGGPTLAAEAPSTAPSVQYGVGLRFPRWVTVPSWFLSIFTAENVPLSTFSSLGAEFFRRKGDLDIVLGISYQKMSPPDGNWLGKGKDPAVDTDFIQFRNFGMLGLDAAFVWRTELSPYFAMHYGGGLGLAFVQGKMLRISNSGACTRENAGDERACRPIICPESGCTEEMLKASEGKDGGPDMPARFKDSNIPGAIPILNVVLGMDFRIPEVKGFELRLEGGFYNAFFAGLGMAYVF